MLMEGFLPIILAIAYAAFSLFSKLSKKNEETEKRKPTISPKLDPMHPQHYDKSPREIRVNPVIKNPQRDKGIEVNNLFSSTNVPYQSGITEKDISEVEKVSNKLPFQVQNLTKENLIQGVVMAEILGAPRSRNPHRSASRKKLPN